MGFAEANPRQLAPSVGKMRIGITISVAPSSFVFDSTTPIQAELGPLKSFEIFANFPASRLDGQTRRSQAFKSYQDYVQRRKNGRTRTRTKLIVCQNPLLGM